MGKILILIGVVTYLCRSVYLLDNGLGRTPPMGWLSWERFRCNIDCITDPENCISERLFKDMADIVVAEGYADAGYQYIIIDDCWLEKERVNGKMVPDKFRFPSGIKALADYIHSKGLKFGIYQDFGNMTCEGYPGIVGHLETDAKTFAEWDVDYIKLDGCNVDVRDMATGYPEFGRYLNATGRPIMYACSWPYFEFVAGIKPNWASVKESCNLWRNHHDIQDSWASLERIINYFGDNQDALVPNAGPGHWNDPDMLIIGNFGLNYEQSKAQMALWAILSAPLLMSVDLRTIRPEHKAILQNKKIIAVDQDPLGNQGRRIRQANQIEYWTKPITPVYQTYNSYAVAILSKKAGRPQPDTVTVTLKELGLSSPTGYKVEDLYTDVNYGILSSESTLKITLNPSGVVMLRADVQSESHSVGLPEDKVVYIQE